MNNYRHARQYAERCTECTVRREGMFCDLPTPILEQFDAIKLQLIVSKDTVLFEEGSPARGVFILCCARAKLSITSPHGKTIIVRVSEPGDVLGLGAVMAGLPYDVTAQSVDPTQATFVPRELFIAFLREHPEAALRVARQLSLDLHHAVGLLHLLTHSRTASEKLARAISDWCDETGTTTPEGVRLKLLFSHEEIGQTIDVSRETVTRVLSEFRSKGVIRQSGSTVLVPDPDLLRLIACL